MQRIVSGLLRFARRAIDRAAPRLRLRCVTRCSFREFHLRKLNIDSRTEIEPGLPLRPSGKTN